jgi:O-antigen/teichoic acid export membrane protein
LNLSQRTIKAGSWQFAAVIARAILQLLVLGVLARYVLPKEFGLIAMANMVMVFIDMFADAGIGPAIIQKQELTTEHIRAAFLLSIVLGIFFVSILWVCAPLIAVFFKSDNLAEIVRWICLSALMTKIGIISRSRIEREMRFDILTWIDIGSYLFGYALVGIVMAILGYGVWAIVVGKLVQCSLQTICLLMVRPNSIVPVFSGKIYKELITYGGGLTLTRIFDNIASQGDYFIVGRFLGPTPLGFYDRASSISSMPGQYLNIVLDKALFPAMSQIQDQTKRLEKAFFMATNIVGVLLIPLFILMVIIAPEIIRTLLGHNWSESILPFQILLVTVVFRIFMNISDTLVRAIGAVYASALRKVISAFLIIFGSWVGQFWGLPAVAVTVDIAVLISFVLSTQLSMKLIGCDLNDYLRIHKYGFAIGCIICSTILPIVIILRQITNSELLIIVASLGCSALLMLSITIFYPRLLGAYSIEFLGCFKKMVPFAKGRAGTKS